MSGKEYSWDSHAPKSLIEYHQGMKLSLSILSKKEITEDPLDPLFAEENQPTMRPVWKTLAKLAVGKTKGATPSPPEAWRAFEQACFDYYDDCKDSLWLYCKTETERRKELEKIASLAEELAHRVAESELAWTSVLYFVRDALEGTAFPEGASIPRIEGLLIDLATEAKETASRPHKHQTNLRLSKRADGSIPKDTFRRAFVRNLAQCMERRYGEMSSPLVANTATVVFGMDTSAEYVRVTVSRRK